MLSEMWSDLRYRLRALFRRAELESELDEEVRFHIERETSKYVRQGASPEEALRRARAAFGGLDVIREEDRDARGTRFIDNFLRDVRYAWRGLRSQPGFATAAVLTLALGIGVNAAMFGVLDRLLFRAPTFLHDPARVHRVYLDRTIDGRLITERQLEYPTYTDLARWSTTLDATAGFAFRDEAVGSDDDVEELVVSPVTASFFGFFSMQPQLGRFFSSEEDTPTSEPVAVLAHAYWMSRYGGSADVLGRSLRVGGGVHRIIGVTPAHFEGVNDLRRPVAFVPAAVYGALRDPGFATSYNWSWLEMLVRRADGVSEQAAATDLTNAYRRSWANTQTPSSPSFDAARARARAEPVQVARGPQAGPDARVLKWVSAMALIVLLIACANVANLLLVRSLRRHREFALRSALGGTRGRIMQQLLTETMLLAALGGVAGLIGARWGGKALSLLFLDASSASVFGDRRTVAFAALATLMCALLAGLAPVLNADRVDLNDALKSGSRTATLGRSRVRAALAVVQTALSIVLLVGAGLFVSSLRELRGVRLGYDVDPVVYARARFRPPAPPAPERSLLVDRLIEEVRSAPGVVNATPAITIPFLGGESQSLHVAGIDSVRRLGRFSLQAGSPEYFATLGTHIVRGRSFTATDDAQAPRVAVVSEAMAAVLWPGREAIGQCFRLRFRDAPCITVIGIAENVRMTSLTEAPEFMYYLPKAQYNGRAPWSYPEFFVRVQGKGADASETVRRALQRVMPAGAYVVAQPLNDLVAPTMRAWQVGATLFLGFGFLALALAAIGLYSVLAVGVAQRSREIGVRRALGASKAAVLSLVVGEGVRLALLGAAIGLAVALSSSRWLTPLLFKVSPHDPLVYLAVISALLGVSVLATALPAIRAARVDPNVEMRAE